MNSKKNLGTTVIDELRLCYTADRGLLESLRSIRFGENERIGAFSFQRVECRHFKVGFNIYMNHDAYADRNDEQVATLKFDRYGDDEYSAFVFFRVENHILYDPEKLRLILELPDSLGLLFNNITALDLAMDFQKNICNIIRRTYKNSDITTIVNNKAVRDRKQTLSNVSIIYATTLDKIKNPSIYIKQAKAVHDKAKGITVCAYDKAAEIRDSSKKQYVLDYYGNPKRLHRLEVHLNSGKIHDYCDSRNIAQTTGLLFNQKFLSEMYLHHLSSVLRFTKGRNRISWPDIFSGRTI